MTSQTIVNLKYWKGVNDFSRSESLVFNYLPCPFAGIRPENMIFTSRRHRLCRLTFDVDMSARGLWKIDLDLEHVLNAAGSHPISDSCSAGHISKSSIVVGRGFSELACLGPWCRAMFKMPLQNFVD